MESNAERLRAIETGARTVVGVNSYTESEPSPLTAGNDGGFLAPDATAEADQIARLHAWREGARPGQGRGGAWPTCRRGGRGAQHHGAVHRLRPGRGHHRRMGGVLARGLRRVPGAHGHPHGGLQQCRRPGPGWHCATGSTRSPSAWGPGLKVLLGKPGLDGHSNGAEQIAVRARDAGCAVVYEGIRLTPEQIVAAALAEGVHAVGLSVLSGSHVPLVKEVLARMAEAGLTGIPVVAGGIIPPEDEAALKESGVAAVYTPKDFDLTAILAEIVEIVDKAAIQAA